MLINFNTYLYSSCLTKLKKPGSSTEKAIALFLSEHFRDQFSRSFGSVNEGINNV
jgi:hypothetical protein